MYRRVSHSNPALHCRGTKTSVMVQKPKKIQYTVYFRMSKQHGWHADFCGECDISEMLRCGSTVIANTDHLEKPSEKSMHVLSR